MVGNVTLWRHSRFKRMKYSWELLIRGKTSWKARKPLLGIRAFKRKLFRWLEKKKARSCENSRCHVRAWFVRCGLGLFRKLHSSFFSRHVLPWVFTILENPEMLSLTLRIGNRLYSLIEIINENCQWTLNAVDIACIFLFHSNFNLTLFLSVPLFGIHAIG